MLLCINSAPALLALCWAALVACTHAHAVVQPPPVAMCGVAHNANVGSSHIWWGSVADAAACCEACAGVAHAIVWEFAPAAHGPGRLSDGADVSNSSNTSATHNCWCKDNTDTNVTTPDRVSALLPSPPPMPPASAAVTLLGDAPVSHTDPRYVSFTIDTSDNRQFFQIDWTEAKIRYLASQLPGYMRVGGSGGDYLFYSFDAAGQPAVGCQHPFASDSQCLNATTWDALNGFAAAAGARVVFGLNICPRNTSSGAAANEEPHAGRPLTTCTSDAGKWDPTNARALLKYTLAQGYPLWGLELGNERNSQQTAQSQAQDFGVLSALLDELYGPASAGDGVDAAPAASGAAARPALLGPDPHSFKSASNIGETIAYIEAFIAEAASLGIAPQFAAVTHHEYIEITVADGTYRDPARLDLTAQIATAFNASVSTHLPTAMRFAGELGPHNGGGPGCKHGGQWANFGDSIWYADTLGTKARHGYAAVCRQDFLGISYALLDCVTHDPAPDYWIAVLFKRLMGTGVLAVNHTSAPLLRAYAHCAVAAGERGSGGGAVDETSGPVAGTGDVSYLLINLDTAAPINVTLPTSAATHSTLRGSNPSSPAAAAAAVDRPYAGPQLTRSEYVLSGPDGPAAEAIALNGATLELTPDEKLPPLQPVVRDAAQPLTVPPLSIMFAVVPGGAPTQCA